MTYGSPATLEDVPRYLAAVRGGRPAPDGLAVEFTRRYRVIGGSPLIAITRRQAASLEEALGPSYRVAVGMRFSEPSIEFGLRALAEAGCTAVAGIILSPQDSPLLMGGYGRAVAAARDALAGAAPTTRLASRWHLEPDFVGALAGRVREGLTRFPARERRRVPVLLTVHSLPRRVAE